MKIKLKISIILFTLIAVVACEKKPKEPAHTISERFGGGIVFYVDESGEHGLIVAEEDASSEAKWGCSETLLPGASGVELGTGQANTSAIVAACSDTAFAAQIADNFVLDGFDDWYLPSKEEFVLIVKANILPKVFKYYWTSSQANAGYAWQGSLDNATSIMENYKNNNKRVMVIRKF
jgi:hypothetical protein